MRKRNIFGGGNAHSNYVPLSDIEQEVIQDLIAKRDLFVKADGFGLVEVNRVVCGDANLHIQFTLAPQLPVSQTIKALTLILHTGAGMILYKDTLPTIHSHGQGIVVGGEVTPGNVPAYSMVWDIGLKMLDPKVVKTLKPAAVGLTSRRVDRDTGTATFAGNMKLTAAQKRALKLQLQGERILALEKQKQLEQAQTKPGS